MARMQQVNKHKIHQVFRRKVAILRPSARKKFWTLKKVYIWLPRILYHAQILGRIPNTRTDDEPTDLRYRDGGFLMRLDSEQRA